MCSLFLRSLLPIAAKRRCCSCTRRGNLTRGVTDLRRRFELKYTRSEAGESRTAGQPAGWLGMWAAEASEALVLPRVSSALPRQSVCDERSDLVSIHAHENVFDFVRSRALCAYILFGR